VAGRGHRFQFLSYKNGIEAVVFKLCDFSLSIKEQCFGLLIVWSLATCFVVAHSSGDLMRILFTTVYIQYNLDNICSAKFNGLVVS